MPRKVDDEYYTRREDVDLMLLPIVGEFEGKRVLCPCDTHESAYVRFFQDHNIDVTWSDRLDYDQFDFSTFSACVTNPPFSRSKDFMTKVLEANKKTGMRYHVMMSPPSIASDPVIELVRRGGHIESSPPGRPFRFYRPDGSLGSAPTCILSNYPKAMFQPPLIWGPEIADDGLPCYKRSTDVPPRWNGKIGVPVGYMYLGFDPAKHRLIGAAKPTVNGHAIFSRIVLECIDASEDAE